MSLDEAFAYCERLARSHYENFPVGSLLVPRAKRPALYSIYAFARIADDMADEGYEAGISPEERLRALEDWEQKLEDCFRGEAAHPVFIALGATVGELGLEKQPLRDLLSAFKQDVVKRRYSDFEELVDYCRRSANPVGRMVLWLFDYRDTERHALADEITTALQLANFWQDLSLDLVKDRIYLPQSDMERYGVREEDLFARRFTPGLARLMKFEVERTREMFARGRRLPEMVSGRLRYELRLVWHGGMRILELIERNGYNTLAVRPRLGARDRLTLLLRTLGGSEGPAR